MNVENTNTTDELEAFSPWFFSPEAELWMETVRNLPNDEFKRLTFLRKKGLSAAEAGWAASQVRLRERAVEKFGENAKFLYFTPLALEQTTDIYIAQYKASRFPAGVPVADLCCGAGGDLMALSQTHPVLGVDRNPLIAAVAAKNVENFQKKQSLNPSSAPLSAVPTFPARVICESAEDFAENSSPEDFPCVHVDPDRRSEGVRTTQMSFFAPRQEIVEQILAGRLLSAVKLAPGSDVPEEWQKKASELEWIGRNRECRQLVVWFQKDRLSSGPPLCRATILDAHSSQVRSSISGTPGRSIPTVSGSPNYLFDVDSTVLAANLEGELAQKYNLFRFQDGCVYLCGEEPVFDEAALSCFKILEIMPLDKKQMIRRIRTYNSAALEIKKRGNVPLPEEVRKWFQFPQDGESLTLFLTRNAQNSAAILAKRIKLKI